MKLTCPHCSLVLELTPDFLRSLGGERVIACSSCGGVMSLPEVAGPAVAERPSKPQRKPEAVSAKAAAEAVVKANRGLSRNMRLLGVAVLLLLGGMAVYLAMQPGGTTYNTKRHVIQDIVRNQFFTDLIASGATTEAALIDGLADVRAHGTGFIGMSAEKVPFATAAALARRIGARVLQLDPPEAAAREVMLRLLPPLTKEAPTETHWLLDHGEPKIFHGSEVSRVTTLERPRRVLLHWRDAALK